MYVNTWHIRAPTKKGDYVLICYGIKSRAEAGEIANQLLESGMVKRVEMTNTAKATKTAPWKRKTEVFEV